MHGRDSTGAWGEVSSDTFIVARIGPAVHSIVLDPSPTNHDPGTTHLSATADATAHAGRTVTAAEYFVDPVGTPSPGSGDALALSGDPATAAVDGDVPLASLAAGGHTILVEAQDDLGHWGATASIQLVIDLAGPVTTSVAVSPNPNNGTLAQDGYPGVVWVTATVTDGGPNPSAVKSAEGFIDPAGTPASGTGWTMMPVDGAFDQPVEQVYAQIPLSEISILSDGSHTFSVRGLDAAGNWGALATGTLQIDKTGPVDHGGDPDARVASAGPVDDPQRDGRRRLVRRPLRVLPRPGTRHERDGHARQPALDHPLDHRAFPDVGPAALRLRPRARRGGQLGRVDAARAHRHQCVRTAGAAGGSRTGGGHRPAGRAGHGSRHPQQGGRDRGQGNRPGASACR